MPTAAPDSRSATKLAFSLTGAAFVAYFSMYAFRKPFTAATYEGGEWLATGIQLKTAFVLSQLLGYAISKIAGIRFCAEVSHKRRAAWLIGCIVVGELALIAFALVPVEWKPVALFVNGLPLGMVWGFVVSYLEGRRTFEALIAGLSVSFILAGGMVKDIGLGFLRAGISEFWMPALVGALFALPFFSAVWWLERMPPPTAIDRESRGVRTSMDRAQRWRFLREFWTVLIPLGVMYLLLTAFRDYRDNYGIEICRELGRDNLFALFTRLEIPITICVFLSLMAFTRVTNHSRAIGGLYLMMGIGLVLLGVTTFLCQRGSLGGLAWLSLSGLGVHLSFVPIGTVLFERLMSATRSTGTSVLAIYFADSFAYIGVLLVQLHHDFFLGHLSHFAFLKAFGLWLAPISVALLLVSGAAIRRRIKAMG